MILIKYDNYIIYSDIDGTLANEEHIIDEGNVKAINYFIDNGGIFSLATGRSLNDYYKLAIRVNAPLILSNGAQVYDLANDKWLVQHKLPDDINDIVKEIYAGWTDLGLSAHTVQGVFCLRGHESSQDKDLPRSECRLSIEELDELGTLIQIGVQGNNDERLVQFQKYVEERYRGVFKAVIAYPGFMNLMTVETSKGNSLRYVREHYLFQEEKRTVLVIGDSDNDMELFDNADVSFAMGNAVEGLRRKADGVLKSNKYPCIPQVLERLCNL